MGASGALWSSTGNATFAVVLSEMLRDLRELLTDEEFREAIASQAYLRERREEAAADREHDLSAASYFAISWDSLADDAKRPYRTAVAEALDEVGAVVAAV
jgi:hypothetical protein